MNKYQTVTRTRKVKAQWQWEVVIPCESRAHARSDLKAINGRRAPAYIRGKDVYPTVRRIGGGR